MHFYIVRRRELGVAISKTELQKVQPIRGNIQISECKHPVLGRSTISAWVFKSQGPEVMPELLDVRITHMAQSGMSLSGIEQVGDCFYAQSWWCRIHEEV
ncbi:hypothetical protein [Pseudomonas typographi]|uniref:Uncharacterized protein n=1 Tax=Pseudomonas typographi TaxID=2715964 RepID=A0ABR7ZAJ7_9PSED|nr:hypothetical protein [Pseudomonas typographi]MBD1555181.1 hypothetical protein [Pseudomonas typographi]MBD1602460.1 hypothetical protein [Pseudomonas typographi]